MGIIRLLSNVKLLALDDVHLAWLEVLYTLAYEYTCSIVYLSVLCVSCNAVYAVAVTNDVYECIVNECAPIPRNKHAKSAVNLFFMKNK